MQMARRPAKSRRAPVAAPHCASCLRPVFRGSRDESIEPSGVLWSALVEELQPTSHASPRILRWFLASCDP